MTKQYDILDAIWSVVVVMILVGLIVGFLNSLGEALDIEYNMREAQKAHYTNS